MTSQTTALTIKEKYERVGDMVQKLEPELARALPKHITPERVARIALTSFRKNPKLLECTPASLLGTVMEASQLGLMLDGIAGEAYPVPFKNRKTGKLECTLIPGYKGLLKMVYQSGFVKSISARVVHEKDRFAYLFGTEERIEHLPSNEPDPGPPVAFYAVAHLLNGGFKIEVMNKYEVDRIRAMSRGKDGDAWTNYYDEMGKKTILRRLAKTLPASTELQRVVALDEMAEAGIPQNLQHGVDYTFEDPESGPEIGRVSLSDMKVPGGGTPTEAASVTAPSPPGHPDTPDPGVIAELDRILSQETVDADDYGHAFNLADPDQQMILDDEMKRHIARRDYFAAVRWIQRQLGGMENK